MPDILSRTQRNHVFELIRQHGLDPADFDWSKQHNGDQEVERLVHTPTNAVSDFSFYMGDLWVRWWPDPDSGHQYEKAHSWDGAVEYLHRWLTAVASDHNQPDLWAELSKGK